MAKDGYFVVSATDAGFQQDRLLRLPEVLAVVSVSKSTWWAGIRAGRYPAGVKLGPRAVAWRASDIQKLIAGLGA